MVHNLNMKLSPAIKLHHTINLLKEHWKEFSSLGGVYIAQDKTITDVFNVVGFEFMYYFVVRLVKSLV